MTNGPDMDFDVPGATPLAKSESKQGFTYF